jgi:hypothetical protein
MKAWWVDFIKYAAIVYGIIFAIIGILVIYGLFPIIIETAILISGIVLAIYCLKSVNSWTSPEL